MALSPFSVAGKAFVFLARSKLCADARAAGSGLRYGLHGELPEPDRSFVYRVGSVLQRLQSKVLQGTETMIPRNVVQNLLRHVVVHRAWAGASTQVFPHPGPQASRLSVL